MNRRINFLSILVLLSFATVFSVAIHAQDKLRISRPTDNFTQSNLPSNSQDNNEPTTNNDNSSDFRINLPANSHNAIRGGVAQESQPGQLTQVQLQKLADHDIILLIDKSGSMATPDCSANSSTSLKSILPSLLLGSSLGGSMGETRWQWCRQQTAQMSALTQQILPAGFSVLLFDSGYYLFPHVTSTTLPRIFANNGPGGGTDLALPLSVVFKDYFKRQKTSAVKIKPLLIGVITDGCPNEPRAVRRLLVDLTHSLKDPKEITIVFFLIGGHDSEGEKFVRDLTEKLIPDGAAFNIVKGVPFSEVQRAGLVQSLADNLD